MKKTLILSLTALIMGLSLAQPVLAASPAGTVQPTIFQVIGSYLTYQSTNTSNGAVINITSTNGNVVAKLHAKYDSLPKTSRTIYNGAVNVNLTKTDNGIQISVTAANTSATDAQSVIKKIQIKFNSPKHAAYQIIKVRLFLKNHFSWAL